MLRHRLASIWRKAVDHRDQRPGWPPQDLDAARERFQRKVAEHVAPKYPLSVKQIAAPRLPPPRQTATISLAPLPEGRRFSFPAFGVRGVPAWWAQAFGLW